MSARRHHHLVSRSTTARLPRGPIQQRVRPFSGRRGTDLQGKYRLGNLLPAASSCERPSPGRLVERRPGLTQSRGFNGSLASAIHDRWTLRQVRRPRSTGCRSTATRRTATDYGAFVPFQGPCRCGSTTPPRFRHFFRAVSTPSSMTDISAGRLVCARADTHWIRPDRGDAFSSVAGFGSVKYRRRTPASGRHSAQQIVSPRPDLRQAVTSTPRLLSARRRRTQVWRKSRRSRRANKVLGGAAWSAVVKTPLAIRRAALTWILRRSTCRPCNRRQRRPPPAPCSPGDDVPPSVHSASLRSSIVPSGRCPPSRGG